MEGTIVTGKFVDGNDNPVEGAIKFVPSRLWINHDGEHWATMAPEVELGEHGEFSVMLTPTHGHDNYRWHYTVFCPVGKWTIQVPESDDIVGIRKLLPARFH